jgi:hypothetical protein
LREAVLIPDAARLIVNDLEPGPPVQPAEALLSSI